MTEITEIKLGAVTVGQSPRDDIISEMKEVLGCRFTVVEAGALDDYKEEEIASELQPSAGEEILVSRLRNGKQVEVGKESIATLLQEKIDLLADREVDIIVVLCTGSFNSLESALMLIEPRKILTNIAGALVSGRGMGVLVPHEKQIEQIKKYWQEAGIDSEVRAVSPYIDQELVKEKARRFRESPVELIFLDCMGYNREMKKAVREVTDKKVILPRTMTAAIVRELFQEGKRLM